MILGSAAVANFTIQYTILSANVWEPLPKIIFSLLAFCGAAVALLLPETKGIPLPDNVQQAESQGAVGLASFFKNVQVEGFCEKMTQKIRVFTEKF